jgi:hypothetical protein
MNQAPSQLGKRKVTTEKLNRDAEDALVFKNSQSALLGGDNPELNYKRIADSQ